MSQSNLLQQIFVLPQSEQLTFLNNLLDGLLRRGHIPPDLAQPLLQYGERVAALNEF